MSQEELQATIDEAVANALAEQETPDAMAQPTEKGPASALPEAISTAGAAADLRPLEVAESGYTISGRLDGNRYLHYAVVLHNPKPDLVVCFPSVRVAARGEDGSIISSYEPGATVIYPEESMILTGQLDANAPIAGLETEPLAPADYNLHTLAVSAHPVAVTLETSNIKMQDRTVTGEVTNPNAYDIPNVMVSAAARNSDGNIVTGSTAYVTSLAAGKSAPFTIYMPSEFTTERGMTVEVTAHEAY